MFSSTKVGDLLAFEPPIGDMSVITVREISKTCVTTDSIFGGGTMKFDRKNGYLKDGFPLVNIFDTTLRILPLDDPHATAGLRQAKVHELAHAIKTSADQLSYGVPYGDINLDVVKNIRQACDVLETMAVVRDIR